MVAPAELWLCARRTWDNYVYDCIYDIQWKPLGSSGAAKDTYACPSVDNLSKCSNSGSSSKILNSFASTSVEWLRRGWINLTFGPACTALAIRVTSSRKTYTAGPPPSDVRRTERAPHIKASFVTEKSLLTWKRCRKGDPATFLYNIIW